MATLAGSFGRIVVSRPGWYGFDPDGAKLRPAAPVCDGTPGLLVHALGDFAVGCAATDSFCVTVNGRAPLGGLRRLAHEHVLELRPARLARDRAAWIRCVYLEHGPAIAFVLPADCSLRCAYSMVPLAGEVAIRCSRCYRLYHEKAAWRSDLDEICPACGWSSQEETP